ncbi:hypothetical protein B0H10DRAFT_2060122 [Mycena sp. CBHHK59/15]|nr:hypothetical protein B0H10DRAFT_2060122 [Mycena sp. CBHHK59/15]
MRSERLEISHKKVHQWQMDGTLVKNDKAAAFSVLPEGSPGGYYSWFLHDQWVLNRALPATSKLSSLRLLKFQTLLLRPHTDLVMYYLTQ